MKWTIKMRDFLITIFYYYYIYVKINIKLYYMSVLNKIIKWKENIYIKKNIYIKINVFVKSR